MDDMMNQERMVLHLAVSVVWMNTHMYIHTTHRESSAEASNVFEL